VPSLKAKFLNFDERRKKKPSSFKITDVFLKAPDVSGAFYVYKQPSKDLIEYT